jgi:hypothetical protein
MSETTTEVTEPNKPVEQGDPVEPNNSEDAAAELVRIRVALKNANKEAEKNRLKLKEFEDRDLSELERAQRAAQEAKAEVEKVPTLVATQLRDHLVRVHEISDDDRDLFLTASDPETLLKQVARLVEKAPVTTGPKPDLTQGGAGKPPALNSNALEEALKTKLGIT